MVDDDKVRVRREAEVGLDIVVKVDLGDFGRRNTATRVLARDAGKGVGGRRRQEEDLDASRAGI